MERTSCCQSRRPTEPAGESLCLPSPTCLQDGGALQSTGEHSRAQRIDHKATNFQRVTTKVARHQPVSVLRRRGFDSRRLHHHNSFIINSLASEAGICPASTYSQDNAVTSPRSPTSDSGRQLAGAYQCSNLIREARVPAPVASSCEARYRLPLVPPPVPQPSGEGIVNAVCFPSNFCSAVFR